MNYPIIPISEDYADGFAEALDSVARELRYLAFIEGPPRDRTLAFIRRNIAENWPQLIALDEHRVIGWCDITPRDRPVFSHIGVLGIGIIDGYRGRGIGPRLLETALQAAKARGLSRIELTVREQNPIAIQLYERFGFFKEGLHVNGVKIHGQYENHLSMALLIPENA